MESLFFCIFGFVLFITAVSVFDREEIAWPILCFVGWVVLSVIVVGGIERSVTEYVASENAFITHTVQYSGGPFLAFFFLGVAVVFVIILWNRVSEIFRRA